MENPLIEAVRITPIHIYYDCPHCWTKYKKNGEPYKTAKRIRHCHGNETHSDVNRTTTRTPHCRGRTNFQDFTIEITDNTIREGF